MKESTRLGADKPAQEEKKGATQGIVAGLAKAAIAWTIVGGVGAIQPARAEQAWAVTVSPYMWLQGSNGDVKVRGVKAHLDDSFLDMLDSSDTLFGAFVHVEARREAWGFYVEGNYSYTSTKGEIAGGINTRVRTGLTIFELGALYSLAHGAVSADGKQGWNLEAVAGGRYVAFNVKLDIGPFSPERTISWVDPLVGLGGHVDLAERWRLIGHVDVGGFGIGSDFTANLYALIGYRTEMFGANVLASFGYRGLYINRDDSSKNNSADLWLHGPVLGMTFRF